MKLEALVHVVYFGLLACAEGTTTVSVGSCDDLQEAANATASDYVVGQLASGGVSCDSWTSFEINNNRLKLIAANDAASNDVFVFNNVRFVIGESGILRVSPSAEFTGADGSSQEVDGGVLNIAEGGRARFKSSLNTHDVRVLSVAVDGGDYSTDLWHGGCIYNNGKLTIDGDYEASECIARGGGGDSADGDGNGIWNGEAGQVVIEGKVNMADCGNREIEGNRGGAIYNLGSFSISSNASFTSNWGSGGGAIYNDVTGVFEFLDESMATFTGNRASDSNGGAVRNNLGGVITFKGGVIFTENYCEFNGGAIGNSGSLSISKSAAFVDNRSQSNGGAIYNAYGAELVLPDATTFEGNTIYDWQDCENIYQVTEDGFECLP
ncbi:unnamed protein product [Ascophyllum nodosum]